MELLSVFGIYILNPFENANLSY